jgi:hypothetical protein
VSSNPISVMFGNNGLVPPRCGPRRQLTRSEQMDQPVSASVQKLARLVIATMEVSGCSTLRCRVFAGGVRGFGSPPLSRVRANQARRAPSNTSGITSNSRRSLSVGPVTQTLQKPEVRSRATRTPCRPAWCPRQDSNLTRHSGVASSCRCGFCASSCAFSTSTHPAV